MKEFTYLSLGAGKQSSALALMIKNNDYRLPRFMWDAKIIFADTMHEKDETYKWITIMKNLGVDIITVKRDYSLLDYFYSRNQIPMGWVNPLCSSHFKRDRIHAYYREQHGKEGKSGKRLHYKNIHINEIMGISIEEFQRMKQPSQKWLTKHYPLIDLKLDRDDCIEIIQLYTSWSRDTVIKNVLKSSCTFCPNQSNFQLRKAHKFYHKDFEYAFIVQNNALKYNTERPPNWKIGKTLQDIINSSDEDDDDDDICDSGYCFV